MTTAEATRPAVAGLTKSPGWGRRILHRPELGGGISMFVVFVVFAILAGGNQFLSIQGTAAWLNTSSEIGIIALGIGLLMMAGEFDLSVGSVVGASSIIMAICTGQLGLSPWVGVLAAVVFGIVVGLINGLIVVITGLPSFIVTLAMLLIVQGGALSFSIAATGSSSISATVDGPVAAIFAAQWNGFQISIVWWIVLLAIAAWVAFRGVFGNWIYATGGNELAAKKAGVPTARVKLSLFVVSSLCAVLVGLLQTVAYHNGNVTLGTQFVFTGVAAAVIGGVLLTGGYGSPIGTALGAITYGIITTGVFFLGWNSDVTTLFVGLLVLIAVVTNNYLRRLAVGKA